MYKSFQRSILIITLRENLLRCSSLKICSVSKALRTGSILSYLLRCHFGSRWFQWIFRVWIPFTLLSFKIEITPSNVNHFALRFHISKVWRQKEMKSNSVVLTLELMIVDSKGVLILLFWIFVARENKHLFKYLIYKQHFRNFPFRKNSTCC